MSPARPTPRLRRNLRLIAFDGAAFSLMVGAGETYLPAFALFVGFSALGAGFVSTLPMLAGALAGLVSGRAIFLLGSHRRWVVLAASVQALAFIPLAFAAWNRSASPWLIYACASAYWAGGLSTGPAWNTWIGAVVPPSVRAPYFGRRARLVQASVLVGLASAGILLHLAVDAGRRAETFALIFAGAGAARILSAVLLASTDEPRTLPLQSKRVALLDLLRRLRHGPDGRLFLYLTLLQVSVHIAAPFFTPFMLSELEMSYGEFFLVTATTYVSKILISPWLGNVARRTGAARLLIVGSFGIAVVPLMWLVSTQLPWLLFAQCVSGFAWASHELAVSLFFIEALRPDERTSLLSLFNVSNAIAVALGALLGGLLLSWGGLGFDAYLMLFLISGLARIAAIPFVRGAGAKVLRRAHRLAPGRILGLRPTSGPIERPIIIAIDDEAPDVESRTQGCGL